MSKDPSPELQAFSTELLERQAELLAEFGRRSRAWALYFCARSMRAEKPDLEEEAFHVEQTARAHVPELPPDDSSIEEAAAAFSLWIRSASEELERIRLAALAAAPPDPGELN